MNGIVRIAAGFGSMALMATLVQAGSFVVPLQVDGESSSDNQVLLGVLGSGLLVKPDPTCVLQGKATNSSGAFVRGFEVLLKVESADGKAIGFDSLTIHQVGGALAAGAASVFRMDVPCAARRGDVAQVHVAAIEYASPLALPDDLECELRCDARAETCESLCWCGVQEFSCGCSSSGGTSSSCKCPICSV